MYQACIANSYTCLTVLAETNQGKRFIFKDLDSLKCEILAPIRPATSSCPAISGSLSCHRLAREQILDGLGSADNRRASMAEQSLHIGGAMLAIQSWKKYW
jgi:hypothetical protein